MKVGKVSFSKINLYDTCPPAYKYEYAEKLKKTVPQPARQFFGTFLDAFVPRLWKEDGGIFYKTPESFAEAGIGYFWQWISGKLPSRQRKIRFDRYWDARNYEKWAREILRGFYLKNKDLPRPVEMKRKYPFEWRGFRFDAELDRVDECEIGGIRKRVIIDYKLGEPGKEGLKLRHGSQFTIYSLAYEIRHGERVPIIWYSLSTGKLFTTQRNDEDYEKLYKHVTEFTMKVEGDVFPPPNFDGLSCNSCEYSIICAERYPDAWSRRKTAGEIKTKDFDLNHPERSLIDTNSESWLKVFYGPDFAPESITEIPIGPRRYSIHGENQEEVKKALSLSKFEYWDVSIVEQEQRYVMLESKTRMPKGLRKTLQTKGLEVYEKIRPTRILDDS